MYEHLFCTSITVLIKVTRIKKEMKFHFRFLVLLCLIPPLTATPPLAKSGCIDRCGNISIPYPFGIGSNCYYNEWYAIACNHTFIPSSKRYKPANIDRPSPKAYLIAVNLEILSISLENQTVTIKSLMVSSCGMSMYAGMGDTLWSMNLTSSPFLLSHEHNKFTVMGCGNALLAGWKPEEVVAGCTAICTFEDTKGCYGINCCQTTIPYYLNTYSVNTTGLSDTTPIKNLKGCSSAFLVDQNWFPVSFADPFLVDNILSFPVVLLWTMTQQEDIMVCPSHEYFNLDLGNGRSMRNYRCNCGIMEEGNPYVNRCQVVEVCASCSGYCTMKSPGDFSCISNLIIPKEKSMKVVASGLGIGMGVLLVAASAFWLYKFIQKRKIRKQKEKFFKRNGGLLLQQQQLADEGAIKKSSLFRARELEKATDYFNENRILGRGGQGTVYKGMLTDGRIVAVKKSKLVDESQLEQFINEVVILSQINHTNVVKLLGCCLETEVPMLVYEFVSNGTLFNYLQDKNNEFPTSLNMRLRIAREVAGALAYLHSATSVPIYHRDIKSTNILLDDKFRAKVSDFGTSRSVAVDKTHLTTFVKGTFGYLDPEYFQSSQFTEKSDVYSFGVVLVELLTGQKPTFATEMGEPTSLAAHFILSMEETYLLEIIDHRIVEESTEEQLGAVADLAKRCLNMNGKKRPTMKEVSLELEAIKKIQKPSTIDRNLEGCLTAMRQADDVSASFEVEPLLLNSF